MYKKLFEQYCHMLDILGADTSQTIVTNKGTMSKISKEIKCESVDGDLLIEIEGYVIKITTDIV